MDLGENLMSNEIGEVFGLDTGRLVAKFSHESESASFVKSYNSQQLVDKQALQATNKKLLDALKKLGAMQIVEQIEIIEQAIAEAEGEVG